LVDASVSNTDGKPCRFDSGAGYMDRRANPKGWLFFYDIKS